MCTRRSQVSERLGTVLSGRTRTVDSQLAEIDEAVQLGELQRAAALLQELCAFVKGDRVADDYTASVRTRSLAEQNSVLLRAHAASLATSAA